MAIFAKDTPPQKTNEPAAGSTNAPRKGGGPSTIGAGVLVDGTISGDGELVIEGEVKGTIKLRSDLRIGTNARVEATVHARNVVVEGTVIGDLSAENRIELVATSSVEGNVRSPKIIVAEGAQFRGTVDMGSKEEKK
jgi:cytoskeletal protein CcmA (bactofilin family)